MSLPWTPLPELIEHLLAPLSADSPCGQDLRYAPEYDQLRELRREDDTSLPTGVWSSAIKRAQWAEVETLATRLLLERSKDLTLASWLGEAWLHRSGLEGLPSALALVAGLCERFPETLYPLAEEGDQSWRAIPLEWLVRRYAEVLLTRVALFDAPGGEVGDYCLHAWQQLQVRQVQANDSKEAKTSAEAARQEQNKLNEQVRATPLSFWLRHQGNLLLSHQHLQRLEAWSDTWLGDQAPGFTALQQVIQGFLLLIEEFIAMHPRQPTPPPLQVAVQTAVDVAPQEPAAAPPDVVPGATGEPVDREEAYRQLLLIAEYLARTEPHSPVPYLIRRAVEWGNKPLNELLGELLSADAEARRVWALLGVL
ncbi:type VI secretion system protein TssA [Pseudomonas sp. SK3(2021)]|uniref:type VI secretion system protein TssA n=1 Tax=Pseudomonas sp. SK3(2021) TaxID=2841064 RepID=UPI00192AE351|nr:type VI secretion system protein TssA [Pseudomonas sp. SK3(2021)]QQZ44390.1 type VI secretion system protein TssA [Pseudomonas sp. SK3(2021)]